MADQSPGSSQPDAGHGHPLGVAHEKRLHADLKRTAGHTRGKWAVRVHLSRLDPRNRPDHLLRSAEATFSQLVSQQGCQFYWLRNYDFFVLFNHAAADAVRSALVKIRFLFAGDPLMEEPLPAPSAKGSIPDDPLATWYRLDADHDRLFSMATALITAHDALPGAQARRHRHGGDPEAVRRGAPLTPSLLAKVVNALMGADLSSHIRRQPVCALVGHSRPDPVFTEVFVSIVDLRTSLLPHIELAANPWLFQYLTQTLDRRVLAMLTRRDDRTLSDGFSINLNVGTILSEEFLRFDDSLAAGTHGTVVLELRVEDIFADLGAYFFARDFVRQRGYRVCIDGLTWRTLPYVDGTRLGADLLKLNWADELPHVLQRDEGVLAVEAIRRGVQGRMILARCDSEQAVRVGQELGFTLFQGRYLDRSLRPG